MLAAVSEIVVVVVVEVVVEVVVVVVDELVVIAVDEAAEVAAKEIVAAKGNGETLAATATGTVATANTPSEDASPPRGP